MKNWKNWLAPILTGLTVAALALLPLRLSILRDGELTGTIHTEALGEDSNFPAKAPPLARRLELLAQYEDLPDSLTVIGQELEGGMLDNALEQLRKDLDALAEAGILAEDLVPPDAVLSGGQVYLRDQTDLSSAGFLNLGGYDKSSREYRSLVVDRESGFLVAMDLNNVQSLKSDPVDAAAFGSALLDRMGLEYRLLSSSDSSADFRLSEAPVVYFVTAYRGDLYVRPRVSWESADLSGGQSAAIGIVTDG